MKTLLVMLLLCGTCLAQQKADPAAAAKLRQQQMELRRDFNQRFDRLSPADVVAIKAVLDKYPATPPRLQPTPAPAPAQKPVPPTTKK